MPFRSKLSNLHQDVIPIPLPSSDHRRGTLSHTDYRATETFTCSIGAVSSKILR